MKLTQGTVPNLRYLPYLTYLLYLNYRPYLTLQQHESTIPPQYELLYLPYLLYLTSPVHLHSAYFVLCKIFNPAMTDATTPASCKLQAVICKLQVFPGRGAQNNSVPVNQSKQGRGWGTPASSGYNSRLAPLLSSLHRTGFVMARWLKRIDVRSTASLPQIEIGYLAPKGPGSCAGHSLPRTWASFQIR